MEYSCIVIAPSSAGRPLLEKSIDAFGKIAVIGNARHAVQLLIQMIVEPVDSDCLVEAALGDALRFGRVIRELARHRECLRVEAFGRIHSRAEPHLERAPRIEPWLSACMTDTGDLRSSLVRRASCLASARACAAVAELQPVRTVTNIWGD